jgi:hypothetical protein
LLNRLFMISRSRDDLWCFHRDVLGFVFVFWLRGVGIFRSLLSGKLVSQTSRLGMCPTLPAVQNPRRSSATKSPDHATFIPFQTPEAFRNVGSRGYVWFARSLRRCGQVVHCHLVRSQSAFAVVADGFNRTSFHGFLAKRLLLRGGRLLKHIRVAAVVAARKISGCRFPAQIAVNALVIAVKLSGHVFRVFIRNVGHRFTFVSCRRKFDQSAFRDAGLSSTCGLLKLHQFSQGY